MTLNAESKNQRQNIEFSPSQARGDADPSFRTLYAVLPISHLRVRACLRGCLCPTAWVS